jgi:uncharacterized protein YceH (UPF0502 family)
MARRDVNSISRRHWKLAVLKELSAAGVRIATTKKTIGTDAFDELLTRAYRTTHYDAIAAASMILKRLEKRHRAKLVRAVAPWRQGETTVS